MKTKCITHPPRQTLVIIREDYLAICDGNHCAAAIMNIFEYWNDHKEANREQAAIENKIAAEGGAAAVNDELWIYKSIPDLKAELLGLFGESKISAALDLIKKKGFLDSRNNPKYGWDRTLQYQLNVSVTQALILRHGTSRKIKASKVAKVRLRSVENKAAIPKTTTETTTKTSAADKPRRLNPVFEMVALKSFGISDTTKLEKDGGRIGKITGWLKKHNATTENLEAFYLWYARDTKGASAPKDLEKFTEWYIRFEETLKAHSSNIIPFDPDKWIVPELEGVS